MAVRIIRLQARKRGKRLRVRIRPESLHLWKKKRDQARWRITGCHAVVRFRRSPFRRRKFPLRRGGVRNSGAIRKGAKAGRYNYTIRVANRAVRDPRIIIH